jgi:hypothetical protein
LFNSHSIYEKTYKGADSVERREGVMHVRVLGADGAAEELGQEAAVAAHAAHGARRLMRRAGGAAAWGHHLAAPHGSTMPPGVLSPVRRMDGALITRHGNDDSEGSRV